MSFQKRLRKHRGWIAFAALLGVAGAVWYLTARAATPDAAATTYTTEAATTGTLSVTVSGTGNLELASERQVWPRTSGTVESVDVDQGETVEKGETLYTLDASDAKSATEEALASYKQAQSQVAQAAAQLAKARSSLSDLENRSALPTNTVSSAEIKAAKADVTSAEASLSSAKAARTQAYNAYEDAKDAEDELVVTAPIAGTVWTVNIEEGDTVSTGSSSSSSSSVGAATGSSAGTTSGTTSASTSASSGSTAPVTIAPNKPLVATLAINEVDIPSLKVDQRVDLEFDALPDLAMTGKVTDIADEGTVSSGVVTFDVEVKLDVTNKKLKPGMTVAATIVTDVARDALIVPSSAVKTDSTSETSYVLVLNADDTTTKQVTVETGLSSDTQTQVVSGELASGDKVVTATSDSSSSSSSSSDSASGDRGGGLMMMGGPPAGGPGGQ